MEAAALAQAQAKKTNRHNVLAGLGVFTLVCVIIGVVYYVHESKYIYTDKAEVQAPLIKLAPSAPGQLKRVTVADGDWLYANETVARVGDEILHTEVAGTAVDVKTDIGTEYKPGDAVVTMVEPKALRVVARVQEDKGLKDVYEGQKALFTVDAFGSRQYEGTVETISETKRAQDVVFSISDKRETKEFEVKISYDTAAYPELRNGMSARVWIVK